MPIDLLWLPVGFLTIRWVHCICPHQIYSLSSCSPLPSTTFISSFKDCEMDRAPSTAIYKNRGMCYGQPLKARLSQCGLCWAFNPCSVPRSSRSKNHTRNSNMQVSSYRNAKKKAMWNVGPFEKYKKDCVAEAFCTSDDYFLSIALDEGCLLQDGGPRLHKAVQE